MLPIGSPDGLDEGRCTSGDLGVAPVGRSPVTPKNLFFNK